LSNSQACFFFARLRPRVFVSHLFINLLVCFSEIFKQSGVLVRDGVLVTNREAEMRSLDCRLPNLSTPDFVFGPMGSGKSVLLQRLSQEQEFCIYANMRSVNGAGQAMLQDGLSSPPQEQFSESLTQFGFQLGMPRRSHFGTQLKGLFFVPVRCTIQKQT
jgi:hypothetical protein